MDIYEMFEKIEDKINKKIEFAEDFRYRYGLQEAMATVKDVMNEYQYKNPVVNDTNGVIQKTRKDDFFEKHPNAARRLSGEPVVCAKKIGYTAQCVESNTGFPLCEVCWNLPLNEGE